MRRKYIVFAICMALTASVAGCDKGAESKLSEKTNESTEEAVKLSDVSQMEKFSVEYTDSDEVPDWEKANTKITLNGDSIEVAGNGATYKDSVITITKAGYYVLSGKLDDGKIVINAGEKDKVNLIFNGVEISCGNDAVINEIKSDKVIITLVEGTNNVISDGNTHSDEEITAAIYCKNSLTINGTGKLQVNGNYNDGITTKDKLKLIDAALEVVAVDDGLVGKDLVAIKSGNANINSMGDGIKSTKTTDIEEGIVCVDGGTLNIVSELDGIQADNYVKINDGVINLTTGGGSDNESNTKSTNNVAFSNADILSAKQQENVQLLDDTDSSQKMEEPQRGMQPMPDGREFETDEEGNMIRREMPTDEEGNMMRREMPTDEEGNMIRREMPTDEEGNAEIPENVDEYSRQEGDKKRGDWGKWGGRMEEENTTKDEDVPSAKGVKGSNGIYIAGGTVNISSSDDSIHANGMVYIKGGEIKVTSGDDGVHADTTLDISGGTIDISKSYEGLEAYYINVSGGNISVVSRDDGLNAAGGNASSSVDGRQGQNRFNAGDTDAKISMTGGNLKVVASGDGIDSNGSITMTGGKLIVCGPESGGNGIVDCGAGFKMDGGTLLGAGTSGMFMSIGSSSKLSVINAKNISGIKGDEIKIYDQDKEIASFIAETSYQAVIISMPELKAGSEYTIKYGDKETSVTAQEPVDYFGR